MIFEELEKVILQRKGGDALDSYTCKLLTQKNLAERKTHEELYEVIEAAFTGDKQQLIYEACDLFYHLLVLLGKYDIALADIDQELEEGGKFHEKSNAIRNQTQKFQFHRRNGSRAAYRPGCEGKWR